MRTCALVGISHAEEESGRRCCISRGSNSGNEAQVRPGRGPHQRADGSS